MWGGAPCVTVGGAPCDTGPGGVAFACSAGGGPLKTAFCGIAFFSAVWGPGGGPNATGGILIGTGAASPAGGIPGGDGGRRAGGGDLPYRAFSKSLMATVLATWWVTSFKELLFHRIVYACVSYHVLSVPDFWLRVHRGRALFVAEIQVGAHDEQSLQDVAVGAALCPPNRTCTAK